ncbi:MAG: VanW family protein [Clostridia bacterium]|nr:VanW family protein [Clostridia bacterium]
MARREEDERAYRAAYPADDGQPVYFRSSEDDVPYPDMVYRADEETEQLEEDEIQAPYIPPAYAAYAPAVQQRQRPSKLWMLWILLCVAALTAMGVYIYRLYAAYGPFRQKVSLTMQDTFALGVYVDQVNIGGMTRAQAEAAIKSKAIQGDKELRLTVRVDGQAWLITSDDLPLERNIQTVLNTAYTVGRQGIRETIGSSITPFEYRYAHLHQTVTSPVSLYTSITYDEKRVRELAQIIESRVARESADAQLASFDPLTRSFTFTQEQIGASLDTEQLCGRIMDALNRRDYAATVEMSTTPVNPKITRAELTRSFTMLSSFTTLTTDNENRNTNIDLAARAINHTVVMPGEVFSFNAATGERTREKGYQPAAAIAGGAVVDEIGGGVCQVSSTLFNAAAMANLTILSRSPHTWPSNYVDMGRDATVNWPNLDFRFRNDTALPVFIVADYQQNLCTVELYGASLGAGVEIKLETAVISVREPPNEPNYEYNPDLAPGTVQEKKKARTGYVVETYKVFMKNGKETRRELLCTSNYEMIQQVLEYNN